jgi:hypothetical protein
VLALANALLPKGPNPDAREGSESESAVTRSILTALTDRAALANNEVAPANHQR